MNEMIDQRTGMPVFSRNPGLSADVNHGAVTVEVERAIAEIQGQLTLAKRFPRDIVSAMSEMKDACKYHAFASIAFYTVPNRGTGLSIRAAEEIARIYGNMQYGHKELSRSDGKSEIEVFAFDMEKNNRSIRQITVMHVVDTKNGPRKLTDQADIDNKIANVAAKQMRGRILALVPKFMLAECIDECKKTLAGGNGVPLLERIRNMSGAFAKLKVTKAHLEKYLGHSLDSTDEEEVLELLGVFNALKDGGDIKIYFPDDSINDAQTAAVNAALPDKKPETATATTRKTRTTKSTPAQEKEPDPADNNPQEPNPNEGEEQDEPGEEDQDNNTSNTGHIQDQEEDDDDSVF